MGRRGNDVLRCLPMATRDQKAWKYSRERNKINTRHGVFDITTQVPQRKYLIQPSWTGLCNCNVFLWVEFTVTCSTQDLFFTIVVIGDLSSNGTACFDFWGTLRWTATGLPVVFFNQSIHFSWNGKLDQRKWPSLFFFLLSGEFAEVVVRPKLCSDRTEPTN